MSLKTKLAIAVAVSLVLVVGIGFFFTRRAPQRSPAGGAEEAVSKASNDGQASRAWVARPSEPEPVPVVEPLQRPEAQAHAVFAPDEVWALAGRVVRIDEAGEVWPVAGAAVFLGPHPRRTTPEEAPPPQRVVTGDDGRFELKGCPGRLWMRLDVDEPSSAFRAFSFQLGDPDASGRRDLGDIPLEPALTLNIELVGPRDEPVEKGRILVGRDDSVKGLVLDQLRVRDSRREAREFGGGKYVLERTGSGDHSLKVLAPGYGGTKQDVVLPHEGPVVVRLAEGKRLAGKVVDPDGKPILAATVELESGPGLIEPDPTTSTDTSGSFLFDILNEGNYEVEARADGFTSVKVRKAPAGNESLELTLQPEAVLSGRVVAESDGKAIDRATVKLEDVRGQSFSAQSGSDGAFVLRKLPGGTYFLSVTHREHARYTEQAREVEDAQKVEGLVFKLPAGITVAGSVVDAGTQEPVANAQVFFDTKPEVSQDEASPSKPQGAGFRRTGTTDGKGRFELKGLGEGDYLISARAPGYLAGKPEPLSIEPGAKAEPTIALTLGGYITGRILDAGRKPVPGAIARLVIQSGPGMSWNDALSSVYNLSATAEAEGTYRLAGLPAYKAYGVRASHPGHPDAMVKDLQVELDKPAEGVDLVLPRGGAIRGRVVDEQGAALAGVTVQATDTRQDGGDEPRNVWYSVQESREKSTPTDAEGRFALEHLRAGTYTVRARARDSMSATRAGVEVVEDEAVEGIELVLGVGERLRGRVTDVDGEPIAGASITVSAKESAQAQTDAEGRFEVKGLAKGDVSVSASKQGFDQGSVKAVVPAARELEIRLDRLAKIAGSLRAEGVTAFRNYRITARPTAPGPDGGFGGRTWDTYGNDPAGTFEIEVKAGTYKLHAFVEKLAPGESAAISVLPGELVDGVVIELERGGAIEGLVVAKGSGAPVEAASVYVSAAEAQRNQELFRYGAPSSKTDAEGRFKLEGIPDLAVNVSAMHESFAQAMVKDLRAPPGSTIQVRIELSLGGTISGIVRKGGVPQAKVSVQAMSSSPGGPGWREAATDADGRFELKGLPAGDYTVRAQSWGKRQLQIQGQATVWEGQTTEIELAAENGVIVSGRVSVGGVPAGGGRIEAMYKQSPRQAGSATIDSSGAYSLEVPTPGAYTLLVQTGGTGRRGQARVDLVLPAGAVEHRQDFDLPAGQIWGIVFDAATGEPVSGAQIIVAPDGQSFRSLNGVFESFKGTAFTQDDGRFEVVALEAGSYSVRAYRPGYADGRLDGVRVDGRPGAPELKIPLERGISCRLHVVDSDGRAVEGAVVFLRGAGGDVIHLGRTTSSSSTGVVELSGIRPGTYEVSASHRSYALGRITFDAQEGAEAALALRPGARLEVTVVGRQGRPVAGAAVDVFDRDGTNVVEDAAFAAAISQGRALVTQADGKLLLEQVPPGRLRVSARTDRARSREERVTVEEGRPAEVRLELEE